MQRVRDDKSLYSYIKVAFSPKIRMEKILLKTLVNGPGKEVYFTLATKWE